jgi:Methylamine utilisation protein MauE
MFNNSYLMAVCQAFTGMLLLASAAGKMGDPIKFEAAVRGFELVSLRTALVLSRSIPFVECAVGLVLLLAAAMQQPLLAMSALLAMTLFIVFGAAIAINLARGRRKISCGCFAGDDESEISWWLVVRNAVLVLLSILAAGWFTAASPQALSGLRRLDAMLLGVSALVAWQLCAHIRRLRTYNVVFTELNR